MSIDYRKHTEATAEDFDRLARAYAAQFDAWLASRSFRTGMPREQAFLVWWRLQGPVGFHTTTDAFRFKHAVKDFVMGGRDGGEPVSTTGEGVPGAATAPVEGVDGGGDASGV